MSFVLDNSVTMCWFFGDGMPLATLNEDLRKAARKAGVKKFEK